MNALSLLDGPGTADAGVTIAADADGAGVSDTTALVKPQSWWAMVAIRREPGDVYLPNGLADRWHRDAQRGAHDTGSVLGSSAG